MLASLKNIANVMAHWIGTPQWFAPRRGFIFKLDSLLFNLGFIATVLAVAFAIRPGMGRIRAWWLGSAGVLFLVSLQQSRLYLLLFHVPFFDVFRAYFLYIAYVIMAALIMAGYGFDAYLTLPAAHRRPLLKRRLITPA